MRAKDEQKRKRVRQTLAKRERQADSRRQTRIPMRSAARRKPQPCGKKANRNRYGTPVSGGFENGRNASHRLNFPISPLNRGWRASLTVMDTYLFYPEQLSSAFGCVARYRPSAAKVQLNVSRSES